MHALHITNCIADGPDPGFSPDIVSGIGWAMKMNVAIKMAVGGQQFYTTANGVRAEVWVARGPYDRLYLRTSPDATVANDLGEITSKRSQLAPVIMSALAGPPKVKPPLPSVRRSPPPIGHPNKLRRF
jgi:hypothetical protein